MSKQADTTGYQVALKNWPTKLAGPKVTQAEIDLAHKLGCRPGKQALAMAMYLRTGGASDGQVKAACIAGWGSSGSHHNKRRDIQSAGYVKNRNAGLADANGHKVYSIELTDKGRKRIEATNAAQAATAKPAKVRQAKPAKPVPAKVETAPVQAPVTTQA